MLIQIGNKVFLTDPMFQRTLGMIISRITEPGLAPAQLTRVDYTLISHIHLDHLNYGSLDMLPRDGTLVISRSAIQYIPEIGFAKLQMLSWWESFEIDGVKITAIPAKHFGGRYGMDNGWSEEPTFCGYVIEYDGTTVLFAGDTGYHPEYFKEIGRRFKIDLALIPIGPIEPRDFMKRVHTDPAEALQIFDDVGARWMIPIHYKTFSQGLENDPMLAQRLLEKLVVDRGLAQQVAILKIGEQRVFKE
jgi:L-ascorbate metabolism protein UlaG (beta-lactamase superfamily)